MTYMNGAEKQEKRNGKKQKYQCVLQQNWIFLRYNKQVLVFCTNVLFPSSSDPL